MSFRHILIVAIFAAIAAGLAVAATRLDQLWLAVVGLSAAFAGGGVALHLRSTAVHREIGVLRGYLETTRQQAAMLAKHTRELRETFIQTTEAMRARAGTEDSANLGDFAALSTLVRDVADAVSDLDRRSETVERAVMDLQRSGNTGAVAQPVQAPRQPAPRPAMSSTRSGDMSQRAGEASEISANLRGLREIPIAPELNTGSEAPRQVRQLVASAIAADRFDLFLQRIVTLPQRKIRAYDVTLRPDGGDAGLSNTDIRNAVEQLGHQLSFDRRLMVQTVRLARMFERRDRDVSLLVDLSQRYLMSAPALDELRALIADAPNAPRSIIISLPHRFFRKAVALEHDALRALAQMGFRFLVREVEAFDLDAARLSQMGVRWIRVSADAIFDAVSQDNPIMGVSPSDLAAVFARKQIQLIADNVLDEPSIAELIDLNVGFAHGIAFAPPQAVRPDAMELAEPTKPAEPAPASAPERRGLRELARRA